MNVYPIEDYAHWERELEMEMKALPRGAFGENFTTEGLLEADVCFGGIF
jgi:MOSC domain-containing protein YiiM